MHDRAPSPEPVFCRDGPIWRPQEEAGGPFGGLHGGAVAGLIVAEMEREARALGEDVGLSANVLLLRPAPMAPLTTETRRLRKGGRVSVFETSLLADGELVAKGTASFVAPRPAEGTPAAPPWPFDPSDLPPWRPIRTFAHKTLFDAQDIRDDGRGTKWARLVRPLTAFVSPLADVFALADNATPFYLTAQQIRPRWSFPNIDITVHLSRPPVGPWLGIEAFSDWRPEGMGYTEARLCDAQGVLGRVCQAVVLTPMR